MINLKSIWRIKEVRSSVVFVVVMLFVYRVAAHIPVPGIDSEALRSIFEGSQFIGLLNLFGGGTLDNFSIAALGVTPFITASIIFQLLPMIFPRMEEFQKEEQGRRKLNQWTRYATIPLAIVQAYGLILLFTQQSQVPLFTDTGLWTLILAILTMTAGTVFLMWVGELITEKNVGNGLSIMISAQILAGLPTFISQSVAIFDRSQLITMILFTIASLVTVVAVVIMNEAQRNIPIQYARQLSGARLRGAVTSHIPLRLNMGGVIPIIFAVSIIIFPTILAQFFVNARSEFLRNAASTISQVFQNQIFYGIFFFVLVFVFTFFYTSVIFRPQQVAENLQKQGGFVPGIRPGEQTATYLQFVTNRILLVGATFLSLIAVLPILVQQFTGNATLVIGGVSILIIVAVAIDSIKQVEAQITLRQYDL